MAVIDTSRTSVGGHLIWGRLSRLAETLIAWNAKRVTRNALNRLSDRELDDIGLHRGDIDCIG